MAVSWDFVDALSAQLGQCKIVPGERREWCVKGKAVAWERPLSKKDLAALADVAPKGRVMAVHVEDLGVKQAWIESVPGVCFTSPHFNNYPAVLVDMELADEQLVRELFSESAQWLAEAR
jgi:hypothetical protein